MSDVLFIDVMQNMAVGEAVWPNTGFGIIGASIEKEGYSFSTIGIVLTEDKVKNLYEGGNLFHTELEKILEEKRPKIVVFSPLTHTYNKVIKLTGIVKQIQPETVVCGGNIHVTAFPDQALKDGFDYVFMKEGFFTFPRFVKEIMKGNKPTIKIIYPEKFIQNLDTLPFISKNAWNNLKPAVFGLPFGMISTSFSCLNSCKFCCNRNFAGTKWKMMSANRVIEEIKYQVDQWNFSNFFITDPNNMLNEKSAYRMLNIVNRIKSEGLKIQFSGFMRLDVLSKLDKKIPHILDKILEMWNLVVVGVESISDDTLKDWRKNLSFNVIKKGFDALVKRDITIGSGFMIGSFHDTRESVKKMISFMRNIAIQPYSFKVSVQILTPYPITDFYNEVEQRGLLLSKDWDLYDEHHLLFKHPAFKPAELEKIRNETNDEFTKNIKERVLRNFTK